MSIENEINQSRFRNEHQKSAINLIYTANWMNEQMKQIFDRFDITSQQFNILRILRGANQPLSTLQIRQRMLDRMSDTSRIVDRLIRKELVRKTICKTDRRLVDITISEKGRRMLDKLDTCDLDMDAILKNISMADAKKLNHLLDKLRN